MVCVKFVPDPGDEVEFGPTHALLRPASTGLLSELDEYALEQALRLGAERGARVTALTVGPQAAEAALRKALQMGADDAVLVSDEAIAGSDVFGTATVLAAAAARLGDVDLVVCGMSSPDAGSGVVPALLAHRLGWPLLGLAASVEAAGPGLRIRRVDEFGVRVAEAALPVVLSITDQSGAPRYPSFKDVLAAKRKTVESLTLADLGVPPEAVGWTAARVRVDEVVANPARSAGRVLVDSDGSSVPELVGFLSGNR